MAAAAWSLCGGLGCAARQGPELQVALAGEPALHGPLEALSTGRLWIAWPGTLSCFTSAAGRTACWGSSRLMATPEGLDTLPPNARATCLAAESWTSGCALVDASVARGADMASLDDNPQFDLCGVTAGGAVRCWDFRGRPSRVRGIRGAVEAAGEHEGGCARLRDGQVACWRERASRPRGDIDDAVDLDVGPRLACAALRSGHVACWREGEAARRVDDLEGAVAVAVGDALACARLRDGGVACWDPEARSPARRIAGVADAVEVRVGSSHACARDRRDALWCWGDNWGFGLGDAESAPYLLAPERVAGVPPAVDIALGESGACARTEGGELWCWGASIFGAADARAEVHRIGEGVLRAAITRDGPLVAREGGSVDGLRRDRTSWSALWRAEGDVDALAAAGEWGCALVGGALECFGTAPPATAHAGVPTWLRGQGTIRGALALSVDERRGCVVTADGRARCWGESFTAGGEAIAVDAPLEIAGLPPVDAIALGRDFACARSPAGEIWCWGEPSEGRLGGSAEGPGLPPRRVDGLPPAAQIAAGEAHACARAEGGELWCWGGNDWGQLGRGVHPRWSTSPAPVGGLGPVRDLALAGDTTCALLEDGGVACWGDNHERQASPRGLLRADAAVPVDPSRYVWLDAT